MNKTIRKIALYSGLVILSWVIVGVGLAKQGKREVSGFRTVILNEENNHFLGQEEVSDLVEKVQGQPLEQCQRGNIRVGEIESSLRDNPYVRTAEAYTRLNGEVVVELELRKPLARVLYEDGSGFYLDREFRKVDLSPRFAANTLLVRGLTWEPLEPRDSLQNEALLGMRKFLEYVDKDEFLRSQVSEVVRKDNGDLMLYPELGEQVIEFGKPLRIEDKFDNLKLFYDKVLNQTGWENYREISLKYRGQIVARK